jgi:hypothetical protein
MRVPGEPFQARTCDGGELRVLPSSRTGVSPLLLVVLDDRHQPQLRRWSRQRLDGYEERGWLAPGRYGLPVRVERFLESGREGLAGARLE